MMLPVLTTPPPAESGALPEMSLVTHVLLYLFSSANIFAYCVMRFVTAYNKKKYRNRIGGEQDLTERYQVILDVVSYVI